jgi:Caspase domain
MMSERIETWAFSGAVYAKNEPSAVPAGKADKPTVPFNNQVVPSVTSISSVSGKNYALLIGINDYESNEIPDLENPLNDAQKIYDVLTSRYTFNEENIIFLKNPKLKDFITTFEDLAKKLTHRDNLLIFYAGHGVWDEKNKLGYWFPADAERSSSFNWFRNSTLRDFIGSIQANHILLIADACFSGAIFKTRDAGIPQSITRLDELPSRKAMTSGILEKVPDESVFIKYLVKGLAENDQKYLTSEILFSSFKMTVIDNGPTVPQFGVIQNVGDEGGDFIFTLK